MSWLVTGGAGYIGAHVVRTLLEQGRDVVVLDDLSTGRPERLPASVPLTVGSVGDRDVVAALLRAHDVTGVVHLAAKKQVGESMAVPLLYYRENVGGCETLLRAMGDHGGVEHLVFSSSAAVYGSTGSGWVAEDAPTCPANPYGFTKLVCENMISDVAAATGLNWITLRYFNVAGAAEPALEDVGCANLIPLALDAVRSGRRPVIFGADYPTADGTCVRDYIHVVDLAAAHALAVRALLDGDGRATYNVGTGCGASVREVLAAVEEVTGHRVDAEVQARRPGDPARVVADPRRIQAELGWRARLGLVDMVRSSWRGRREQRPDDGSRLSA